MAALPLAGVTGRSCEASVRLQTMHGARLDPARISAAISSGPPGRAGAIGRANPGTWRAEARRPIRRFAGPWWLRRARRRRRFAGIAISCTRLAASSPLAPSTSGSPSADTVRSLAITMRFMSSASSRAAPLTRPSGAPGPSSHNRRLHSSSAPAVQAHRSRLRARWSRHGRPPRRARGPADRRCQEHEVTDAIRRLARGVERDAARPPSRPPTRRAHPATRRRARQLRHRRGGRARWPAARRRTLAGHARQRVVGCTEPRAHLPPATPVAYAGVKQHSRRAGVVPAITDERRARGP